MPGPRCPLLRLVDVTVLPERVGFDIESDFVTPDTSNMLIILSIKPLDICGVSASGFLNAIKARERMCITRLCIRIVSVAVLFMGFTSNNFTTSSTTDWLPQAARCVPPLSW